MKLAIIKAIISWLWRNHKYLLRDYVCPAGSHCHRNPRPKEAIKQERLESLARVNAAMGRKSTQCQEAFTTTTK